MQVRFLKSALFVTLSIVVLAFAGCCDDHHGHPGDDVIDSSQFCYDTIQGVPNYTIYETKQQDSASINVFYYDATGNIQQLSVDLNLYKISGYVDVSLINNSQLSQNVLITVVGITPYNPTTNPINFLSPGVGLTETPVIILPMVTSDPGSED